MAAIADDARRSAVAQYRANLLKCRELESSLRTASENLKKAKKDFQKSGEHIKILQCIGQAVGEVLRKVDNDRFIVKVSTGPRYLLNCRSKLNREKLKTGTRVCLDPTTLTIMRVLPREPCIIFMDEIDAIGGRRFSKGTSADREIQRTLMELLNQLDGFDELGKVKVIMATNRPDVLDPALLRPGRLDRKIEIPLPNEQSRLEILKIHAARMAKHGEIDYEAAAKLAEGFNAADMRNVCTEAGMAAIREERDYAVNEDFMKAVRKLTDAKKLESSADYKADFA